MRNQLGSLSIANDFPRTDVSLYGLVHGVLEAERARDVAERRDGRRHSYRCIQSVAPMRAGRLPEASQFRPVRCVDLSAAGLSYLDDESPVASNLIVALGTDNPVWMIAAVVRDEFVAVDGEHLHRVACRFTGRAAVR